MQKRYRVWAEISLKAIRRNLGIVKETVGPRCKVLAVVKADAYGYGAVEVSKAIEGMIDMLGVGDSTEAIELREAGIKVPILILGAIIGDEVEDVVRYDITPTIHSLVRLRHIEFEARRQKKRVKVHLKVDTGMGRLGASPENVLVLVKDIVKSKHLELEGIGTHFSSPKDREFTSTQLARFNEVTSAINALGIDIPLKHAAASFTLFRMPESRLNMVRVGFALYGMSAEQFLDMGIVLEPALSLKSQVIFLKHVPSGTPISYERTFVTQRPSFIATIPVGYNDGFRRALSNRAQVIIRGKRAPVVGTVTMDYIMADVTDNPGVRVGDTVTIVGKDGAEEITLMELATLMKSIPYEVSCGLGKRVKKIYLED